MGGEVGRVLLSEHQDSVTIMEYYVCSDGGQWYIGGRVSKKGTEIESKRFQYQLEDWESQERSTYTELRSMEIGLTLIGPEAKGCVLLSLIHI